MLYTGPDRSTYSGKLLYRASVAVSSLPTCSLPDSSTFSVSFLYTHTYIHISNSSHIFSPPILPALLSSPALFLALVIPVTVAPSSYIPALKDQFFLNISVFAREEKTDFNFVARDTFRSGTCLHTELHLPAFPFHMTTFFGWSIWLHCSSCRFQTPDIDIVIGDGSSSKVAVGNSTDITATFNNLLPVTLTKVQWFVEGSGLTEPLKIAGRYIRTYVQYIPGVYVYTDT